MEIHIGLNRRDAQPHRSRDASRTKSLSAKLK
jgi:hypothetical protein